jgi:hypothetical protein
VEEHQPGEVLGGRGSPEWLVVGEVVKATFDGDIPGWQWRAVADGDPRAVLRLHEGKETMRRGGNEVENGRRGYSPRESEGDDSKCVVPGGGFRRRGEQTTSTG